MKLVRKESPTGVVVVEQYQRLCILLREEMCALKREVDQFNVEIGKLRLHIQARNARIVPFPAKPS